MRKACPVCGRLVLQSCYHGEESVNAMELPDERIRGLLKTTIDDLEADLERFRDDLKELE